MFPQADPKIPTQKLGPSAMRSAAHIMLSPSACRKQRGPDSTLDRGPVCDVSEWPSSSAITELRPAPSHSGSAWERAAGVVALVVWEHGCLTLPSTNSSLYLPFCSTGTARC
jgi:hypothetical protein